jgi:uncharacterized repeat protein (TIGR01451 family)
LFLKLRTENSRRREGELKTELQRPKILLGVLVALALTLSVAMGVSVMAESPPGANTNNVAMLVWALPAGQKAGENVDYYMEVSNDASGSGISADAVNITLTFYPAQADGNPSATGTVVWQDDYLEVGGGHVIIVVTYPMPALNPGVTAAVSRAVLNGTALLETDRPFSIVKYVAVASISWTIDKTVTDVGGHGPSGSVDKAGDTISYKVVISNTGDVSLQGSLVDSLPGIYDMTGPAESGGNVTGWLEPGENWTYTYKYNAKQSDIDANGINKNGVADGDGDIDNEATFTDNYVNSQSDIEDVPILQNINWTIDKTVTDVGGHGPSGSVDKAGDIISYKVVISNTGATSLQGSLADSLPGVYNMTGPVESGGNVTGWLEPGENWTYTYKYNAKQSDIDANGINKNGVADGDGDIDNEATFTDNHANSQSDVEDVPIQRIGWTIDKTVTDVGGHGPSGSVDKAGDTISYKVVISNTGDVSLQGNLVDSLPGTYNMSGPVESGGNVTGWLEPGENWTYTYKYNAKQSDIDANGINKNGVADGDGDIDNEATFTDNHANSQSDVEDVPILQNINWTIDKTVTDVGGHGPSGSVDKAGDIISYKVVISNTGATSLQGSLADSLPGVYNMTGPVESGGNVTGWLEPGENWTYTYKYNAKQSDIDANGINKNGVADGDGDIDNEATFTDNHANSKSDIEDVPIRKACIHIEKTTNGADGLLIPVGDNVTWRYVVTNCGSMNLTNIVVRDDNGTPGNPGDDWSPTRISGDDGDNILETTETWVYQATGTATAGYYANIGYVTGRTPEQDLVSDSDPSNYYNRLPVGWETYPVNKVRVLLPWIGLLAAIIAGASLLVLRRRRLS